MKDKIAVVKVPTQMYLHCQKMAQAVISGQKVAAAIEAARYEMYRKGGAK
jgi:hypothetical protein